MEWQKGEGVPEWIMNPLATTQLGRRSTVDIGFGPGKWNNANAPFGVGIYADLTAGIDATFETLINGHFPEVWPAVENERIANRATLSANIRTWGTTGFARAIDNGWDFPESAPIADPTP